MGMKRKTYQNLTPKERGAAMEALGYKFSSHTGRKGNKIKKRLLRKATRTAIRNVPLNEGE